MRIALQRCLSWTSRYRYFERVEALLRRSLGVSLSAKGAVHIRPAPPVAMGPISEEGVGGEDEEDTAFVQQDLDSSSWVDWQDMKKQIGTEEHGGVEHDEL